MSDNKDAVSSAIVDYRKYNTPGQVVNACLEALIKQGRRSLEYFPDDETQEFESCTYFGNGGDRCGVGLLLTEDPGVNGDVSDILSNSEAKIDPGTEQFLTDNLPLMEWLQGIHDHPELDEERDEYLTSQGVDINLINQWIDVVFSTKESVKDDVQ